jgi:hypothetical protein
LEAILEAARSVSSDHEQGELLKAVARKLPEEVALPPSYFQALESIGTDHEHQRTLSVALERPGLTEDEAGRLLATAGRISGDFQLAELLSAFARNAPRAWTLPESFFQTLAKIDSATATRRVLETVLDHRDLDPELAAAVLAAARPIPVDSERASLLVRFLEVYPSTAELPEELDRLIRSVDSDYERSRIEDVLAAYRRRESNVRGPEAEPPQAEPEEQAEQVEKP